VLILIIGLIVDQILHVLLYCSYKYNWC